MSDNKIYCDTYFPRYQPTTIEKVESDIGFTVRKKMNVDDLYMDRDSQVTTYYASFNLNQLWPSDRDSKTRFGCTHPNNACDQVTAIEKTFEDALKPITHHYRYLYGNQTCH